MLERYFVRPTTLDRLRASWIGKPVEQYVAWMTERGYAARNVYRRVPLLIQFGEFAHSRGATSWETLPDHVEPFVRAWLAKRGKLNATDESNKATARGVRGPIYQLLRLVIPGYSGGGRSRDLPLPFLESAPQFFSYLRGERGLSQSSLIQYVHHLRCFEDYLAGIGVCSLRELSPAALSGFITDRSRVLGKRSVQRAGGVLRVFLRYLHREDLVPRDLGALIEVPQQYRHADVPRSISWSDAGRVLETVDRRSRVGRRDYAILLLLVTYGLRAREVAALRLDDIDWKRERFQVPERKAGHSTAYPLSPIVGRAIVDYLQHGRPDGTLQRALFLRAVAPHTSVTHGAVSRLAKRYLREAGIDVPRPGSHTLRHTCVQRLVDAHVSLKVIGDYVGHRTPTATEVYTKVALDELREVAMGEGEELL